MTIMQKSELAITDPAELHALLGRGRVLRLAMCKDGQPYVLPMNYGWAPPAIYMHTARKGLKLEYLAANPKVAFEVTPHWELARGPNPCKWDTAYECVLGRGRAVVVEDEAERMQGLMAVAAHYLGQAPSALPRANAARPLVLRIDVDSLTGRRRPLPAPPEG